MCRRHLKPAGIRVIMAFDPPKKRPQSNPPKAGPQGQPPQKRVPDTYEDLAEASKEHEGLFGRVGQAFQDVLQSSRGDKRRAPATESAGDPRVTADDLAIRRAKSVKPQRMIVPMETRLPRSPAGRASKEKTISAVPLTIPIVPGDNPRRSM